MVGFDWLSPCDDCPRGDWRRVEMSPEMNIVIKENQVQDIFSLQGTGGRCGQRIWIARSFLFFAAATQCLRRIAVLAKEFFLIIYDEDFYGYIFGRNTLAFTLGERGNRNKQVHADMYRCNRCDDLLVFKK